VRLHVLDHLSDPGTPGKANDDSFAVSATLAAVFDGATGLSETPIFPAEPSDAAWLARLASRRFAQAGAERPVADIVRELCAEARDAVAAAMSLDALPRWAWPASSFQMIRLGDGGIEIAGLGDSVAYLLTPGGGFERHCPIPLGRDREAEAAARARAAAGGDGPMLRQGVVLERLRAARSRLNTPGGAWTLGLDPAAGDHLRASRLAVVRGTKFLVMSDGFAALAEGYGRHQPAALIGVALERGLPSLLAELRHVEQVEDPDCRRFPRFKQSDDATAILGEIAD